MRLSGTYEGLMRGGSGIYQGASGEWAKRGEAGEGIALTFAERRGILRGMIGKQSAPVRCGCGSIGGGSNERSGSARSA